MGLLTSDSFLAMPWLQVKHAETAPPGGAPGPMASVVPGQVSSAPGGPISPPTPVPSTNPLTGATATNPGVTTQARHGPAVKKSNFEEMQDETQYHMPQAAFPMRQGFADRMKHKMRGFIEGMGDYTLDRLEDNNRVMQRPGDPFVFNSDTRQSPQI